jgi:hypothetical protein
MHETFLAMHGLDAATTAGAEALSVPLPPLIDIYEPADIAIIRRVLAGQLVMRRLVVRTLSARS